LGLGLEGQDVIDWLKTNSEQCQIEVFDDVKEVDLTGFDLIFRSPGFYRLSPMLKKAESKGIEITSATKLFFALSPAKIIGVTGTKGKGTTASLISKIMTASGKKIHLAGNIGYPPLQLLPKLKKTDWVCLELSSFQLQDLTQSPHVAVVLNTTSEHLDVHQDTVEYCQAKENIVRHQIQSDYAVINADYEVSKKMEQLTRAQVYFFSRLKKIKGSYVRDRKIYFNLKGQPQLVGEADKLQLRGEHNWENVTAAITAASLAGADLSSIQAAVFAFKGLEHRLELVSEVNGVKFYNDSFSTTPETSMAAIKAFKEPMTLILGGSDKGSDYGLLAETVVKAGNLRSIILIGQMALQIEKSFTKAGGFKGKIIRHLKTMEEIVKSSFNESRSGSVVVLSPGCASFDSFKNYKDRGERFKKMVKSL
jgi:UDP-N-acetylmuramoylalanine--D-glutamate ligase